MRRLLTAIMATAMVVQLLGRCAPADFSRPVPNSRIDMSTILGNPCQWQGYGPYPGRIVSVREVNDAGPYPLYLVTCSNGASVDVAQ